MVASWALRQATILLDFLVIGILATYNAILESPDFNALWAIVSTYHLLMKFLIPHGMGEEWDDQALVRWCYVATLK